MEPIEDAVPAAEDAGCQADWLGEDLRRVIESGDAGALRAALLAEAGERRRAECLVNIQTEITQYTLDLLVRVPNLDAFFRAQLMTLSEKGESQAAGVWLIDEDKQCCDFWMAHLFGEVFDANTLGPTLFPRLAMAQFLYDYKPGWDQTMVFPCDDPRLPAVVRDFNRDERLLFTVVAPLILGGKTLGWINLCVADEPAGGSWWRIALVEAVARHVALALHKSRLYEQKREEERRKAILEERNRLARDIHDNLAQGFGAILMQLQAAQREGAELPAVVARSIDVAVDLARTHMVEARRSVGALRPNVSNDEDLTRAIKRVAGLVQKTTDVPIDVQVDELPRFGDGVEREVLGIAQEALTNAARHARAARITVRASTVRSIGLRLSIADDGRGVPRERTSVGYGLAIMQERADRIGASLTIVTAPRNGTEVVLAWTPAQLPTQVHGLN
ncbi:MAG: sensor histidine kinase [Vicinamibacterales bacterium]